MGIILSWLRGTMPHTTNDSETISTNMRKLRNRLVYIIDIQHGLLNTLRSTELLNEYQIEVIKSMQIDSIKVSQLIDDFIAMSPEHQDQFMTALNETQQSHVVEYIYANGIRTEAQGDNWPIRDSLYDVKIIKNWAKLIEMIDSKNGLLDKLLSVGCINSQHKKRIEASKTDDKMNDYLLAVLRQRSISDYNNFLESLKTTKNYSAVILLEPDVVGNIRLLSAERRNKLTAKHALLVAKIDTKNGLLAKLWACECITGRQMQFIEAAATEAESNTRLLEIVKRGSESDFDTFVYCLNKTGQHHVSSILMEDGVVVQMVAKISGNTNVAQDEQRIVEQFKHLLNPKHDEGVEMSFVKLLNQLTNEQLGRVVRLAALDTQGSIRLFYLCNLTGVNYLDELYSSMKLKTHIEEIFTLLLDIDRPVSLDSLMWNTADYINGTRNLYVQSDLLLLEEIYQAADNRPISCHLSPCLLGLELLPSEMIEMLLIKVAGQLFVIFNKMTPRAEAYTVATLSAVSYIWWRILTYRQFNKRLLKHYFRQICHPYICNPHQLSRFKTDRYVWGVAELNYKLYVACGRYTIEVFTSRPPFSRLEDIKVKGLKAPRDFVVCSETGQLYIADLQCAIWRVNLLSKKHVDKFITTQWEPVSLSIKSRRLIVTPLDGDELFIYDDDGVQLNQIPLPDYMKAQHAVESSRNTYIVSHYKRLYKDKFIEETPEHKDGVSEVDVDGRIIRQFSNQLDASLQFNEPYYLLMDASNHVIVADTLNERIVLLKPDLQLKRVLIQKLQEQPFRMCFNEETGLLFVSCLCSNEIRIFTFQHRHNSSENIV